MRHHPKVPTVFVATISFIILTKLVSVPMRLAGAIVSIVPVAGNVVNDVVGDAANAVDAVPI